MSDTLSILSHVRNLLAKKWCASGEITPYDRPKYFTLNTPIINDIRELSELMEGLELSRHSCVIRGRYVGDERAKALNEKEYQKGKVLRQLDAFEDQALHSVMIEVDKYQPLTADAVTEPQAAIAEYIKVCLPAPFQEISYHWQLSNSAGRDPSLLKVHLWFWLAEPATSEQLRIWADQVNLPCDHTVFNPAQVHYTSAPIFEDGVADPVPVRSGFYDGILGDEVDLDLSHIAVGERKVKERGLVTSAAGRDPTAAFLRAHNLVIGVGREGQLHIDCPFQAKHGGPRKSIDEASYFLQGTGGHDRGTFTCFHDSCKRRIDYHTDVVAALNLYSDDFEIVVPDKGEIPQLPRMARNGKGQKIPSLANLSVVFSRPDYFGIQIRFDTFHNNTMFSRYGAEQWRALKDADVIQMRRRLETVFGFATIGREIMRDAIIDAADCNQFDSAQHWLKSLVWDGVPRIETFYSRYFGTVDDEYTRAVARYTWSAMAGRVMHPGIKADMVPILFGKQGAMKSSGVKAMCPHPDFFTEIDLNNRDEDQSRILRGKLIGEIAELKGLNSRDAESIKSFIARTHEEWIPKYQELATVFPRRLIFIGTTNEPQFLSDPTGNRRWLPMAVGMVDVDNIARDMKQLWAEARQLYQAGGVDWSAERLAAQSHATYRRVDPWEDIINDWLDTPDDMDGVTPREQNMVTIKDIARHALMLDVKNYNPTHYQRIGNFLRVGGWSEVVKRNSTGKQMRVWQKEGGVTLRDIGIL